MTPPLVCIPAITKLQNRTEVFLRMEIARYEFEEEKSLGLAPLKIFW